VLWGTRLPPNRKGHFIHASASGAYVATEQPEAQGAHVYLAFDLPISGALRHIQAVARVVQSNPPGGGLGSDALVAGSGQDVLIAGTTAYDNNPLALKAVMAEWTSSRDFATRVAQLQGRLAGGLNGSYVLTGNTVLDDNAIDLLLAGPGRDWLFMNFQGTGLHDLALDAQLQDLLTDVNPY